MDTPKVFESEYRFCLVLWANEPVKSTELVRLCKQQLGWSKGVSKADVQTAEVGELMEKRFGGSVPAFLAAFTKQQDLSDEQLQEILRIIEG